MAGGHLEQRLGRRYVSIGTFFHHGAISSDWGNPTAHPIGPPPTGLLDATLGGAAAPLYLLSLPDRGPAPVRDWLRAPATMRMILPSYVEGEDSAAYDMTVPSLADAFDSDVVARGARRAHVRRRGGHPAQ